VDVTVIEQAPDGVGVVTLRGQLDIDTAPDLSAGLDQLLRQPVPRIVVHLGELTFCDSIGLSALAMASNQCARAGGFLRLSAPSPFLMRVLSMVELTPTLPVYASVAGACADDPAQLITR